MDKKLDVIIPAYMAHGTMLQALGSIAIQTVADRVRVTIVDDCCPDGDYEDIAEIFRLVLDVQVIRMEKNSGPGLARQKGIDSTSCEFFTFLDADDVFYSCRALEQLLDKIEKDDACMCASGAFWAPQYRSEAKNICQNRIWVFGKVWRRSFTERYRIRFNGTRANEDCSFCQITAILCDNPKEQMQYVEEYIVEYRENPHSITRNNNNQYYFDQSVLGAIDNCIYTIEHTRKYRHFSGEILEQIMGGMMMCYTEYIKILDKMPVFAPQAWEYIKKYYHRIYKPAEGCFSDDAFRRSYSREMAWRLRTTDFAGVIPQIGIREFMAKVRREEYDPNLIYEIWADMKEDPETRPLMENNIACGVCPPGYTDKPGEGEDDGIQV